jgi:hypothetical protein
MRDDKPDETLAEVKKMDDLEWQRHQLQKKAELDDRLNERVESNEYLNTPDDDPELRSVSNDE